jgi:glycosyltransferase involved in cell wall biosynthesis
MKVIIIEFVHYQYALTLTELFKGNEIVYIFSKKIKDAIVKFAPGFNPTEIWEYEPQELEQNLSELISRVNNANVDLFCIDPIFDNFKAFARISKEVKAKKILTTHNINTWFRPKIRFIRSVQEKMYKKQIIDNADYIAVEDFIYQYLKEKEKKLFSKYNFIYIPYTIFYSDKVNKIDRKDNKIKVVLPGSVDYERRRYESTIEAIKKILKTNNNYIFSFAGPAKGEYGERVLSELKRIKKENLDNIIIFENPPKPEEFKYEMESADVVLSTSTKYFTGFGTVEEIGKTKPTAAIHDMISFVLPGILPSHLNIPDGIKTSSLSYHNEEELLSCLLSLNDSSYLLKLKKQAEMNSRNFSAEKIIGRNPFSFTKKQ